LRIGWEDVRLFGPLVTPPPGWETALAELEEYQP